MFPFPFPFPFSTSNDRTGPPQASSKTDSFFMGFLDRLRRNDGAQLIGIALDTSLTVIRPAMACSVRTACASAANELVHIGILAQQVPACTR